MWKVTLSAESSGRAHISPLSLALTPPQNFRPVFVDALDASPEATAISSLVLPRQLLRLPLCIRSFAYTDGFFSHSPHSVIRRPCRLFLQTIPAPSPAISTIPVLAGGTADQYQDPSKASYLAPLIHFLPCH